MAVADTLVIEPTMTMATPGGTAGRHRLVQDRRSGKRGSALGSTMALRGLVAHARVDRGNVRRLRARPARDDAHADHRHLEHATAQTPPTYDDE
jgi:hypothetical protein